MNILRIVIIYVLHPLAESVVIQHVRIRIQPLLRVRLQVSINETVHLAADIVFILPDFEVLQFPEGQDAPVQENTGLIRCRRLLVEEIV